MATSPFNSPDHRSMQRQCLNVIGHKELHYAIALGTMATDAESLISPSANDKSRCLDGDAEIS